MHFLTVLYAEDIIKNQPHQTTRAQTIILREKTILI